ncbi:head-tail adaptor protein [Sinorhizobium medicae]|uniref:head-tail adaptor protein n=1 Tax=Sinorhizobium medicae TaxID=110321 RepID=UPI0011A30640|nr:head-tail adaptor protein [Sinorhizobium medicae]MDX0512565.1 head-tail adaptor protein [Sinorhizobium medicae]MDX0870571.1 head-tail adaptor protein [Sinorhizobium medicae]MDX0925364.1 head-tail adaptor protein [Sinorhizobium medicae]MDX0937291.1 head-tail adaptor protein [Sinorhizobium medicae]MDX0943547.1 head-tail adaptor protein [Sinorhizobium medicae]
MAKKPSAGRMHQRLHFQKREAIDDGAGNEVSGPYETVFTSAAELIPLRGGEPVQAARLVGVQPYTVRIRSCAAAREVTTAWRIVDARNASRVMNIRTVTNPDQKNAWLDLLVDDGAAT